MADPGHDARDRGLLLFGNCSGFAAGLQTTVDRS